MELKTSEIISLCDTIVYELNQQLSSTITTEGKARKVLEKARATVLFIKQEAKTHDLSIVVEQKLKGLHYTLISPEKYEIEVMAKKSLGAFNLQDLKISYPDKSKFSIKISL